VLWAPVRAPPTSAGAGGAGAAPRARRVVACEARLRPSCATPAPGPWGVWSREHFLLLLLLLLLLEAQQEPAHLILLQLLLFLLLLEALPP
jgi:hypothetical protein